MDPEETLSLLLAAETHAEALERAVDLLSWLAHGGHVPSGMARRLDGEAAELLDNLARVDPAAR